jgi:hypothetical protein
MKNAIFLMFTALFLIFTAAAFSQEYDDYNGYTDSNGSDSYDEYEDADTDSRVEFSLKTLISFSYYEFPTLFWEGYPYPPSSNKYVSVQAGMNLMKDFYLNINADFNVEGDHSGDLGMIAGSVGWKRINAMVRYQNTKGLLELEEDDKAENIFMDYTVEILTADIQYDIFGLPFKSFREQNWAGLFLGLSYCNYTVPATLWIDSIYGLYAYDPALHIESAGISIYTDTMVSALLYGSNFMNFESENYSILPWISLYGNFHIGRSEISKTAVDGLNNKLAEKGIDASAEKNVWVGGIVFDAVFGLGFIYKLDNFSFNLSGGFTLNIVSTAPLSDSRGRYSPSLEPVFHREGWVIKAGISF